jgi:hypothetical protein
LFQKGERGGTDEFGMLLAGFHRTDEMGTQSAALGVFDSMVGTQSKKEAGFCPPLRIEFAALSTNELDSATAQKPKSTNGTKKCRRWLRNQNE